jgi:hypothetical protein
MMALHLLALAFGGPAIEFMLQLFVGSERFVRQVGFLRDASRASWFAPLCIFNMNASWSQQGLTLTVEDGTSRSVLQFSSSWGHVLRIRLRRLNLDRSIARNAPRKSTIL